MGMIPYLTQWGESSYFGIFKGKAAAREYEGVIAEMLST